MDLLALTTDGFDVSNKESKSEHEFSHLAMFVLMDEYISENL